MVVVVMMVGGGGCGGDVGVGGGDGGGDVVFVFSLWLWSLVGASWRGSSCGLVSVRPYEFPPLGAIRLMKRVG